MTDEDIESSIGQPFWTLPLWSHTNGQQADVKQIIEKVLAGTVGNAMIRQSHTVNETQVVELSARPVRNEGGRIVSIVVEGMDITERVPPVDPRLLGQPAAGA